MQPVAWSMVERSTYPKEFLSVDEGQAPGRVLARIGPVYELVTPDGLLAAELSGRLRHLARRGRSGYPAVGDYVAVGLASGRIERLLPRRTVFVRKEAGRVAEPRVLCANVDWAVIVTTAPAAAAPQALGQSGAPPLRDFSVRRIERYLTTLDSGIRPLVVLNKCDLIEDPRLVERYTEAQLPGIDVAAISALTGEGVDRLEARFASGSTVVLVGSSGSGKSTLAGALIGEEIRTAAVRATDGRGRHTTTVRRSYALPGGALLIDTPGIRELQPWAPVAGEEQDLHEAFPEIVIHESECRFADCRHGREPGCAVRAAVLAGEIDPQRFESYLQLTGERDSLRMRRERRLREQGRRAARRSRAGRGSRGG